MINVNEISVMFLFSKFFRFEDIVIDFILLYEINCYFIFWNRNNILDENIKIEFWVIIMNDFVKVVDWLFLVLSLSFKIWIYLLYFIKLLDG